MFVMQKRTLFTSSAYSILQATAGLLLHPYQSMQYLIEGKAFSWMAFIPIPLLGLFLLSWWGLIQLLFNYAPYIGLWAFILIWGCCFFAFWQILLFYLFVRFLVTLR